MGYGRFHLGFSELQWGLPSFTRFYWVLLIDIFYWALVGYSRLHLDFSGL